MSSAPDRIDPILDRLHAVRAEMLSEAGGSLERLVAMIQQHEAQRRAPALPANDHVLPCTPAPATTRSP